MTMAEAKAIEADNPSIFAGITKTLAEQDKRAYNRMGITPGRCPSYWPEGGPDAPQNDPDALAEREAIQAENGYTTDTQESENENP